MITKLLRFGILFLFSIRVFAQEKVIYQFGAPGSNDGFGPNGGLIFDSAGNIYGTTGGGASFGAGTVFELSPTQDGSYQETILYEFCPGGVENSCPDGRLPTAGLIRDAEGNLYGTTTGGGGAELPGPGTVFEISPSSRASSGWTERVLWNFSGNHDGQTPNGGLITDTPGNFYGTTSGGGKIGFGTVFELTPAGNTWTETVIHDFCAQYPDCSDGAQPKAGVTLDKAGNLYGTTVFGGQANKTGLGVTYELSPMENGWTETVLKAFTTRTGGETSVGITIDPAGNLYGGLSRGIGCGQYFRLKPFVLFGLNSGDGCSPDSNLVYQAGAMYGSTQFGGLHGQGVIFKLTRQGNHAVQTVLYDFCQEVNCTDGSQPLGPPTYNNGKFYGATFVGGNNNTGVIFEVNR